MSYQDDLIEPEAIESAEHFSGLIRLNNEHPANDDGESVYARRERLNQRRPLPRDLGN